MRKRKQDWLEEGIKRLGQAGVSGLTIERLAEALGVTKGSFYHHFKHARDFEEQLMAFWADQYLSTAANVPAEPGAALALLDTIMEEAFSRVTEPEVAIRAWAHQDEMVRSFVQRVDAARYTFVLGIFRALGHDEAQARLMADMLFTMLIGSVTALPRVPPARVLELYAAFKRLHGLGT